MITCTSELKWNAPAFLEYWIENYPDVITGWNVQLFDIPYIAGRIARVIGEKESRFLSPWRLISRREIYIKGRKQIAYDLPGIATLDYLNYTESLRTQIKNHIDLTTSALLNSERKN